MGEIKAETEQQQRDRESLLASKQQLEKDIAAYHCLLDGEQSRWGPAERGGPAGSRGGAGGHGSSGFSRFAHGEVCRRCPREKPPGRALQEAGGVQRCPGTTSSGHLGLRDSFVRDLRREIKKPRHHLGARWG